MKTTSLLPLPLIALLLTGCPDKSQPKDSPPAPTPRLSQRADAVVDKTKEIASDTKEAIAGKLTEWKLTPADIKADLTNTGRVVREKTLAAGEKVGGALDNARIVTVINGKYVADRDLSALKINVDADNGVVPLTGTAGSVDLIGRAIALALNTDGVTRVIGLLKVEAGESASNPPPASADTM